MSTDHPGMERVLSDAIATSRSLAAKFKLAPDGSDLYGEHCSNCDREWCLPADRASCAHKAICETCWPNGCDACEAEVEENLRRREEAVNRIISAALELRVGADDLSEADLGLLDWRARKDVLRHVELAADAIGRVQSILTAQMEGKP